MKIKGETIIRTILLAITLLNQVLLISGRNPLPFAEEDLYAALSTLATLAATVWAWWKNNSFTAEALEADRQLTALRAAKNGEEDLPTT